MLKDFKAVPPLVTDINLSLGRQISLRFVLWNGRVLCSTMYRIHSIRRRPARCALVALLNRTAHPKNPDQPLAGGPQMVEVSRDGKRIYFTNSLYAAWDEQFYPDGVGSWMVKLNASPDGGIAFDENFFLESNDYRVHQVRLEGGDSSSDSYCFP